MNVIKIVGITFALVGAVFLIVAVVTFQNTQQFIAGSVQEKGEVINEKTGYGYLLYHCNFRRYNTSVRISLK